MIAPTATNPKLTEQGFSNVFRVVNRDTEQARLAGDCLAEQWADANIAILRDGTVYGRGLAEEPGDNSTSAASRKPNSARSFPVSRNTPRRLPRSRRRELRLPFTAATPPRPLSSRVTRMIATMTFSYRSTPSFREGPIMHAHAVLVTLVLILAPLGARLPTSWHRAITDYRARGCLVARPSWFRLKERSRFRSSPRVIYAW